MINQLWLIAERAPWKLIYSVVLGLVCLVQFAWFSGFVQKNAEPRAVIYGNDTDAAKAIRVATRTRLYNDNGWRPYGPIYYRLTHVLHHLGLKNVIVDPNLPSDELNEKRHHYGLMMVSLICLFAISFLLAWLITDSWPYRLLAMLALPPLFLSNDIWAKFILRAHPDFTFAFCVGLASVFSLRYIMLPGKERFKWAAVFWGIATSAKMTTLMFAPGVLAMCFREGPSKAWENVKSYFKYFFISYFIVGFPQNFIFWKNIRFLFRQKPNVVSGDLEFLNIWLELFYNQAALPLLGVLGLWLLLPKRKIEFEKSWASVVFVVLFCGLPLVFMMSRRVLSPYEYYPIPFIVSALVGFIFLLHFTFQNWASEKLVSINKKLSFNYKYLFILCLGLGYLGLSPEGLSTELEKQKICRPEIKVVIEKLSSYAKEDKKIFLDPYTPYRLSLKDHIFVDYAKEEKDLTQAMSVMALKRSFYSRYIPIELGGSPIKAQFHKNFEQVQNFYLKLWNKLEYQDPFGRMWKKTYEDNCDHEIWETQ